MSVKIVQKSLPVGVVPYEEIADPVMKKKVMLLNRNIASISSQLAEVQKAAIELQNFAKRKRDITDPDEILRIAAADATSKANAAVQTAAADATSKVSTHANDKNVHVTKSLQDAWSAKYSKPSGGIPKSDMDSSVRDSLDKADRAITSIPSHGNSHRPGASDPINLNASDVGALPEGYFAFGSFSGTTGSITTTSKGSVTVNVTKAGYTPVLVGSVYCFGNGTSLTRTLRACVVSSLTISGNNVVIDVDLAAPPQMATQTATVHFTVMYIKS